MTPRFEIKPFDVKNASNAEYRAANAFSNLMRAEQLPDDPPIPLDEQIKSFQNIPSFVEVKAWAVECGAVALASGSIALTHSETNQHIGEVDIQVLPEYRRQGIARQLLARIVAVAQREHRTLLIMNTTERIPAGEAFMRRLGATQGLINHTNQLDLRELNRDLIRAWQIQAQQDARDFELGLWEGMYPEEDLADIVTLWDVMNSAPRDALQIDDWKTTLEQLRQIEQSNLARGRQPWTMYVREKSSHKFAGYTEVFWHPNRPQILNQGATAVFPRYRNHGLGRWLKAAMLDKVLRDRPQVKYIRTGNADSNAPMLKINLELGFKPYISRCVWQVETEKGLEYLDQKQMANA